MALNIDSNEALHNGSAIRNRIPLIGFYFFPLQLLNLEPCAIQITIAKCGTLIRIATSLYQIFSVAVSARRQQKLPA